MGAIHPGVYLKEIIGYGSQRGLAKKLGVSPSTVNRLVSGGLDVSATMALRLEEVFGRTAESWLKMQTLYDLEKARALLNCMRGQVMEDRELIKMAAKAMGGDTVWADIDGNLYTGDPEEPWNPLDDLDQAKRIRHKLHLSTGYDDRFFGPCAYATYPTGSDSCNSIMEKIHDESGKRSSLRRAIVRAAAEIGKAMP